MALCWSFSVSYRTGCLMGGETAKRSLGYWFMMTFLNGEVPMNDLIPKPVSHYSGFLLLLLFI